MEDEEGLLEKVSLLLITTVVFFKTPLKCPDHKISEMRSAFEDITVQLFEENTGLQVQVCFTEWFFLFIFFSFSSLQLTDCNFPL